MEISYGQGPCDEYYIPTGEGGQCPEGHRFIDEMTDCVPENRFGPPPPECLEAGPEICGEEPPPEEPPGSNGDTNGNGNDDTGGDGDGEDGSNGNRDGDDNGDGEDIPSEPLG